jgi:hypothetical protein
LQREYTGRTWHLEYQVRVVRYRHELGDSWSAEDGIVDVKSAPHAMHTASRTKLAQNTCRIRSVPVNFPETDKG